MGNPDELTVLPRVVSAIRPEDPAQIGTYPPTLPIEIALRVAPLKEICEAYNISQEQWQDLRHDPVFQRDLAAAVELVRKDGMSVKLKAGLQAEEMLKTSWAMVNDNTGDIPPSVRADLLKFTFRVAGLIEPPQASAANVPALNIQINL